MLLLCQILIYFVLGEDCIINIEDDCPTTFGDLMKRRNYIQSVKEMYKHVPLVVINNKEDFSGVSVFLVDLQKHGFFLSKSHDGHKIFMAGVCNNRFYDLITTKAFLFQDAVKLYYFYDVPKFNSYAIHDSNIINTLYLLSDQMLFRYHCKQEDIKYFSKYDAIFKETFHNTYYSEECRKIYIIKSRLAHLASFIIHKNIGIYFEEVKKIGYKYSQKQIDEIKSISEYIFLLYQAVRFDDYICKDTEIIAFFRKIYTHEELFEVDNCVFYSFFHNLILKNETAFFLNNIIVESFVYGLDIRLNFIGHVLKCFISEYKMFMVSVQLF